MKFKKQHLLLFQRGCEIYNGCNWSLFRSSDEASFTTESTRDSFSNVDYASTCNIDTIPSIFNTLYGPQYSRNFDSSREVMSKPKEILVFLDKNKTVWFVNSSHFPTFNNNFNANKISLLF